MIRAGHCGLFLLMFCAFGAGLCACKKMEPIAERAPIEGTHPFPGQPDASSSPDGAKSVLEAAANPAAILDELVDFITERSRFPLGLADAEAWLRPWGPTKHEQESTGGLPAVLALIGQRGQGLCFQIEYQFDGAGAWKFHSAGFDVTDPSGFAAPTYKRLFKMIRGRLGKPAWTEPQQGRLKTVGWKLRHRIELVLSEEVGSPPTGGPKTDRVVISISEPEGEPD